MSRDEGFRRADLDVGILDDPKVRRLVRSSRDEGTIARALLAYIATITASWRHGERVSLEDSAPAWMTALDDLLERLVAVDLLDAGGMIPEHAWDAWFQPAAESRDKARERWKAWSNRRRKPPKPPTNGLQTADKPLANDLPTRHVTSLPPGSTRPVRPRSINGVPRQDATDRTCPGCGHLVDPSEDVEWRYAEHVGMQPWHRVCTSEIQPSEGIA